MILFLIIYLSYGKLRWITKVNGAFIYLTPEEMNQYRSAITEAIYEAEKFYRQNRPES